MSKIMHFIRTHKGASIFGLALLGPLDEILLIAGLHLVIQMGILPKSVQEPLDEHGLLISIGMGVGMLGIFWLFHKVTHRS